LVSPFRSRFLPKNGHGIEFKHSLQVKIIVAPDSFKESLSATQVAEAISSGIKRVIPAAQISCVPFADGGEGTVEALVAATNGKLATAATTDPLGRPVRSFYGILGDGQTAVIEMAAASGLELLKSDERNPLLASTYGTGLLLKAALEAGFTNIILGIGGSATNDGGAGMAQALGFRLLDRDGNSIAPGGGFLHKLNTIDRSAVNPALERATITVACDVRNPLLGTSGATRVYGPQKGASPAMLEILEHNLSHWARILQETFGTEVAEIPGAGAAGGLGAGLIAFCKAQLVSGFDLIAELTGLEKQLVQTSLIFTGEGRIDDQTISGKTISGMARLAKKHEIPLIALAGFVSRDLHELYSLGVTSVFPITNRPMSLDESKAETAELLADTAERVMRAIAGCRAGKP
jgi:glycerate kinase